MSLQLDTDRTVLASSDNPFWRTPAKLVELLFNEFPIAVDLAASAEDTICGEWLGPGSTLAADALQGDDWSGFIPEYGFGFLNPPYSRKLKQPIEPWIRRCAATAAAGRGVIAVLPAAIQTQWWQEYVWEGRVEVDDARFLAADEIRFFPHRVSFDPPASDPEKESGNANVNTAVVIWRPQRPFVGPWTPHIRYWTYR